MKQTSLRIITGSTIVAIGAGALLDALGLISFWGVFSQWWPALLIIGGGVVIAGDPRKNYIWGLAMVIIGSFLLLKNHGVIDFSIFSLIVPTIIIAIGLSVLANTQNRAKIPTGTKDTDDIVAVLSGSETRNTSKNYKGGKLTAIFGGVVLDLRDAKLKEDAHLDVFTLCGGVELRVPRDWKVVVKTTPIAGGVENKSEGTEDHKGPTLILTGTVALGGVEIKT